MWYDSEKFADYRFDNTGGLLAATNGNPALHRGDYGFYAVFDQMVWQSVADSNHSVSLFGRLMGTPQADRNLVDFALNFGATLHQPLPGRDDDTLGIGVGYTHVSGQVAAFDRDLSALGTFTPTRTGETFVELTYQIQLAPWWQLQPDFQYVFNVGGGEANPLLPTQKIKNEAVIGLRTNITF